MNAATELAPPSDAEPVELPGQLTLRDAARMAWLGGFELRLAWTPYSGMVLQRLPLGADLVPAHLRRRTPR